MILLLSSRPKVLKEYFGQNNIEYIYATKEEFKTESFYTNIAKIKNKIKSAIVYNFGHIINSKWLQLFPFINYHFSLLPKYRGATPIPATILNQDKFTGITCQHIVEELDAGNIICQKKYKRPFHMTAGELFDWLENKLPHITQEILNNRLYETPGVPQGNEFTLAPKDLLRISNAKLRFAEFTAKEIVARILAFNPEPLARAIVLFNNGKQISEREFIIHKARIIKNNNRFLSTPLKPGSVLFIKKTGLVVGTLQGNVHILQAGFSGKKVLSGLELLSLKGKIKKVL